MNYFFRKYEFDSQQQFLDLKSLLETLDFHTFVELGVLTENKFSVDVLWYGEPSQDWTQYEIWDIEGNGAHTFFGWSFNQ